MSEVKHGPGPTGLPRYMVRVEGDAEWSHDSISAALDHAARRVYMGPAAKVVEAQRILSDGRTYRYAYGMKSVEIEPTGPEIPPSVVAAAPEMLEALRSMEAQLSMASQTLTPGCKAAAIVAIKAARAAIAKAEGQPRKSDTVRNNTIIPF